MFIPLLTWRCLPLAAQSLAWLAQETITPAPLPHWVRELLAAILALIMLAIMIYWLRPGKTGTGAADFKILVDPPDVQFVGKFPAKLQGMVEEFLLEDCQIPSPCQIFGQWDDHRLVITVRGPAAQFHEQRIRNFLKLNVKRPST